MPSGEARVLQLARGLFIFSSRAASTPLRARLTRDLTLDTLALAHALALLGSSLFPPRSRRARRPPAAHHLHAGHGT
eukprot:scaffold6336_cov112-Isochrysis_galbana.AAC.2